MILNLEIKHKLDSQDKSELAERGTVFLATLELAILEILNKEFSFKDIKISTGLTEQEIQLIKY